MCYFLEKSWKVITVALAEKPEKYSVTFHTVRPGFCWFYLEPCEAASGYSWKLDNEDDTELSSGITGQLCDLIQGAVASAGHQTPILIPRVTLDDQKSLLVTACQKLSEMHKNQTIKLSINHNVLKFIVFDQLRVHDLSSTFLFMIIDQLFSSWHWGEHLDEHVGKCQSCSEGQHIMEKNFWYMNVYEILMGGEMNNSHC